ncbi:hypothetical protein SUGI_0962010 [Cryptomeria japonica]|nr:hypothetical protein SUGI_0962010 [Cryptomeria japonica]
MTRIHGLLNLSYPCLSEVTLSPMEVEIWWMGLVWFLLAPMDFGLSFNLLYFSTEVDIFPIEVGRWLEEAIGLLQLFKLQPGDLYNCSSSGTTNFPVEHGKTYLLCIVNAAVNNHLFFKIASHNLTVVSVDASYTKPYTTDILMLTSGQTTDVLLTANQAEARYYMAAKVYTTQSEANIDNTTTTAILGYVGSNSSATPILPDLPVYNDTATVITFTRSLRSLSSEEHTVDVPQSISDSSIITVGLGLIPCETGRNCSGPNNTRLAASMNNISFVLPDVAILQAYYFGVNGVFTTDFPSNPPVVYNYTGDGTNIFQADNHPMHIHGYDFYIVGEAFGNYDNETDPSSFNLVDPPQRNTVGVPANGWAAIRFKADNPGAWFVHCHFDDHVTWGLDTVFIVKNGPSALESLIPPPADLPKC